ncbi:MAG: hypothetical protein KA521_09000 [Crocinitomicaceae bacterium]|nr:hypothetical protein [Crocinitomicaceae bacterium]
MTTKFTRISPNFNKWENPSGKEGKCKASKLSNQLYEEKHGFGWEEWLFEDYHAGKELCLGFLQAFNDKNKNISSVDIIHLYTRICIGKNPKQYYIGYIKDVKILPKDQRAASEVIKKKRLKELETVGIINFPSNDLMWKKCINIQFERKNVIFLENFMENEIQLNKGQFRFSLYDFNKHPNFIIEINKHL